MRCSDAGCAAVFLPFWDSCGYEVGSAEDYADVVALCEARVASDSGNLEWRMVAQDQFAKECDLAQPEPAPAPEPGADQCIMDAHGPHCQTDSDCTRYKNCVRCAHSGYCTMVPY